MGDMPWEGARKVNVRTRMFRAERTEVLQFSDAGGRYCLLLIMLIAFFRDAKAVIPRTIMAKAKGC